MYTVSLRQTKHMIIQTSRRRRGIKRQLVMKKLIAHENITIFIKTVNKERKTSLNSQARNYNTNMNNM